MSLESRSGLKVKAISSRSEIGTLWPLPSYKLQPEAKQFPSLRRHSSWFGLPYQRMPLTAQGHQCQSVWSPVRRDSSVSQSGVQYAGTAVSVSLESSTQGQQCQSVWCPVHRDSSVSQSGVHYTRTAVSVSLVSTTQVQQCQSVWCPVHGDSSVSQSGVQYTGTAVSVSLESCTQGQQCQSVWCPAHRDSSVSQSGVQYAGTAVHSTQTTASVSESSVSLLICHPRHLATF